MPVLALARSDKSATVAGSVAGPQPGHTAGPKQVGRGRSRNQRPQISAHGLGGCCGSQADNPRLLPPLLPTTPATRETTESHPFGLERALTGRPREGFGAALGSSASTSAEAANAERPPEPCAQVRILPRVVLDPPPTRGSTQVTGAMPNCRRCPLLTGTTRNTRGENRDRPARPQPVWRSAWKPTSPDWCRDFVHPSRLRTARS
jgi:hypothetical protein